MMSHDEEYYILDPAHTDPARMKKEREKAQKLRKSQWWLSLLNRGLCHYCGRKFVAKLLTMDHVVPLARGGTSTQGNIVPACRDCNRDKKLGTPVEDILKQLHATGELGAASASEQPEGPDADRRDGDKRDGDIRDHDDRDQDDEGNER